MKRIVFVYVGIVSAVVLIVVATRWWQVRRFDPVVYTQMYLDAAYKDEYETEKSFHYLSQEDAKKIYKENIDAIETSFKTASLSDGLEKDYKLLFEKIMKNVRYEVLMAKRNNKNEYTVTIKATPMMLFDDTLELFQEKSKNYSKEIANAVMKGEAMPAENDMKENIYQLYYEVLAKEFENNLRYGSTQNLELHIKKKKSGGYSIEKADIRQLENLLISQKKMTAN